MHPHRSRPRPHRYKPPPINYGDLYTSDFHPSFHWFHGRSPSTRSYSSQLSQCDFHLSSSSLRISPAARTSPLVYYSPCQIGALFLYPPPLTNLLVPMNQGYRFQSNSSNTLLNYHFRYSSQVSISAKSDVSVNRTPQPSRNWYLCKLKYVLPEVCHITSWYCPPYYQLVLPAILPAGIAHHITSWYCPG